MLLEDGFNMQWIFKAVKIKCLYTFDEDDCDKLTKLLH